MKKENKAGVIGKNISEQWRREWEKFYKIVFRLQVDFSTVVIEEDPGGFSWVVIVAQGLTLNQVWSKCQKRFDCSYSAYLDDLDRVVTINSRTSEHAYAKRFRERIEADEENEINSEDDLIKQSVHGITLLERLLLELWYHRKTHSDHLDQRTGTLCVGSRFNNGYIPRVYCWASEGEFNIHSSPPDSYSEDNDAKCTRFAV